MKLKDRSFQISCDGGGATGKSTGAKLISKKYKLTFLSSGMLYRYASYLILKYQPKDRIAFLKLKFGKLNHKKLSKINLHSSKISEFTSIIAKNIKVRSILKKYQINFSKKNLRCCIEGRDISTKILPESDVKFFFKCNLDITALRRFRELKKSEPKTKLKDVRNALISRNRLDKQRRISPLLKHRDSIVIDTGKLNKKKMLEIMSKHVEVAIKKKYGI